MEPGFLEPIFYKSGHFPLIKNSRNYSVCILCAWTLHCVCRLRHICVNDRKIFRRGCNESVELSFIRQSLPNIRFLDDGVDKHPPFFCGERIGQKRTCRGLSYRYVFWYCCNAVHLACACRSADLHIHYKKCDSWRLDDVRLFIRHDNIAHCYRDILRYCEVIT